jgi:hypothetical protein
MLRSTERILSHRGRVASDVVWAKLKSLSEGARIASSRLF